MITVGSEKRIRQRLDYRTYILCYKHIITGRDIKPDPSPIRITIHDISYSGLGVRSSRDLARGDYLMFNLETSGITKELMLEVKWCRYSDGEYEAGLAFVNLTKESILFIDDLIKSHIRRKKRYMDQSTI